MKSDRYWDDHLWSCEYEKGFSCWIFHMLTFRNHERTCSQTQIFDSSIWFWNQNAAQTVMISLDYFLLMVQQGYGSVLRWQSWQFSWSGIGWNNNDRLFSKRVHFYASLLVKLSEISKYVEVLVSLKTMLLLTVPLLLRHNPMSTAIFLSFTTLRSDIAYVLFVFYQKF